MCFMAHRREEAYKLKNTAEITPDSCHVAAATVKRQRRLLLLIFFAQI